MAGFSQQLQDAIDQYMQWEKVSFLIYLDNLFPS
jgi:hypothetical protein